MTAVAYIDLEPNGHINRLFCAPEAAGRGDRFAAL
jgi:hypothetical protein